MKTTRVGAIFILVGFSWIAINSYLQHSSTESYHSFRCIEYSDFRCEWALSPLPAKVVLLVGVLLVASGIVATIYKYIQQKVMWRC